MLKALSGMGATREDMAHYAGCSEATLRRNFDAVIKEGRLQVRNRLRIKMFNAANAGNTAMLIYLSKQFLNMADRTSWVAPGEKPGGFEFEGEESD